MRVIFKNLIKIFIFSVAFSTSGYAESEFSCLTKSVYLEGRGLHNKEGWRLIANTILNRQASWTSKRTFGAKSPKICDIVTSKEFTSRKKFENKIKEKKVFVEIKKFLLCQNLYSEKYFYFSSDPQHNMYFSKTFHTRGNSKFKIS